MTFYKDKKLLPTVNFLDQVTLHSWIDLRKLAIDYGKKYFYRHEIFMPVAFYLAMGCLLVAFLMMVNLIPFSTSDDAIIEKKKVVIASVSMSLYFFVQFFWLLYSASYINDEFSRHREILKGNKDLLQDILMFKEFYFANHLNPHLIESQENELEDELNSNCGSSTKLKVKRRSFIMGTVKEEAEDKEDEEQEAEF